MLRSYCPHINIVNLVQDHKQWKTLPLANKSFSCTVWAVFPLRKKKLRKSRERNSKAKCEWRQPILKGGLISEVIFNLVLSSKKYASRILLKPWQIENDQMFVRMLQKWYPFSKTAAFDCSLFIRPTFLEGSRLNSCSLLNYSRWQFLRKTYRFGPSCFVRALVLPLFF